ncbi:uncharacterized protein BDW43DRAFT_264654, partial [Aspergillus alliaceus]|uniref:uncharacterized protein n=1 Tax=Petromyces alliaceus TaxID=209559 RepID=UPI0012A4D18E
MILLLSFNLSLLLFSSSFTYSLPANTFSIFNSINAYSQFYVTGIIIQLVVLLSLKSSEKRSIRMGPESDSDDEQVSIDYAAILGEKHNLHPPQKPFLRRTL